ESKSSNAKTAAPWDAPSTETVLAAAALAEEEEGATVPPWLWVCIALIGSCLVMLSAYFGFMPHK
ncbi:MAG: hypothetical protein ABI036_19505, partial [Fibrobacteria bacterium]